VKKIHTKLYSPLVKEFAWDLQIPLKKACTKKLQDTWQKRDFSDKDLHIVEPVSGGDERET
jgi:hypothetical protein